MSAIATVSTALQGFLEGYLSMTGKVVLTDPTKANTDEVSLWLYQVTPDEFARNRPPTQVETANGRKARLQLPPLGVNLYYLVTPKIDDQNRAQTTLADILLAFHEEAQFAVENVGAGVRDLVTVTLVPDSLDDRVKLWESLSTPYRLSVCYQVRTVRLVSAKVATSAPVGSLTAQHEERPPPRVVN